MKVHFRNFSAIKYFPREKKGNFQSLKHENNTIL